VLLGIVLFALALNLRTNQPGLLELGVPPYAWPAGAGVVYAAAALIYAGFTVQAGLLLVAMAAGHVIYASAMGFAFSVLGDMPPSLSLAGPLEGLVAYPPAVLLQVAFILPAAAVALVPWLRDREPGGFPGEAALAKAGTPAELLHATLSVAAAHGSDVPPALAALASRAQAILLAETAPEGETREEAGEQAVAAEAEQAVTQPSEEAPAEDTPC